MLYPEGLLYSKEHEWAKIEGEVATIGITHHAQDKLGDVVFVEAPKVGADLKQMAEFGVVESVKTVSTLFSPLSGKVLEVNPSLGSQPELINEDPYGKGWIIKLKLSSPSESSKLLSSKDYQAQIKE